MHVEISRQSSLNFFLNSINSSRGLKVVLVSRSLDFPSLPVINEMNSELIVFRRSRLFKMTEKKKASFQHFANSLFTVESRHKANKAKATFTEQVNLIHRQRGAKLKPRAFSAVCVVPTLTVATFCMRAKSQTWPLTCPFSFFKELAKRIVSRTRSIFFFVQRSF